MPMKSANMLRANKHTVILSGKPYKVKNITRDGAIVVIDLGEGGVIRRTPGAKLEVR